MSDSICLNCIYGNQPYGYFPIICVQGDEIVEMWKDKRKCKHFEAIPEPPQEPKQEPFKVIIYGKD